MDELREIYEIKNFTSQFAYSTVRTGGEIVVFTHVSAVFEIVSDHGRAA